MSRNDNYTTGKLLDYLHHQKYYKLIGIDRFIKANKYKYSSTNKFRRKIRKRGWCKKVFLLLKSSTKLFRTLL